MNAINLIQHERNRQLNSEGFTLSHDDQHTQGELARAAACYALGESLEWPIENSWWKPTNPIENLTKSGALIVAEMERLARLNPDLYERPAHPIADAPKLLHAIANPTDMVARCGFEFQLDKPAGLLNAKPEEVCHKCAVLAYAAAENRYIEELETSTSLRSRIETLELDYQDARNLWNVAPEDKHSEWIVEMQEAKDQLSTLRASRDEMEKDKAARELIPEPLVNEK